MIKGSKATEETRAKMRGNKNALGNRVSKEHKAKMKKFHTGKKWNLNGKHTEETKKHLSEKMKGRVFSEETREKLRQATLRFLSSCQKGKETSIEKAMRKELRRRKIEFVTQKVLCKIARVDFYLPDYKVVIQCDGIHWHSTPDKVARDRRQDKVLRENGYLVFRFTDKEINENVSVCVDNVVFLMMGNILR